MLHAWAPVVSSVMITIGSMLTPSAPGEVSVDNVDTTSFMLTPWALCWHCELPVRTDENWQRKHRPRSRHRTLTQPRSLCRVWGCLVWAEFLRNHGQKMCSGFRVYHLCCQICPACHALGQKSEIKNSSASSFYPPPPTTTPPNNLLPAHIDACPRQPIIKYFYRYI